VIKRFQLCSIPKSNFRNNVMAVYSSPTISLISGSTGIDDCHPTYSLRNRGKGSGRAGKKGKSKELHFLNNLNVTSVMMILLLWWARSIHSGALRHVFGYVGW
jgi:hypothetical protein